MLRDRKPSMVQIEDPRSDLEISRLTTSASMLSVASSSALSVSQRRPRNRRPRAIARGDSMADMMDMDQGDSDGSRSPSPARSVGSQSVTSCASLDLDLPGPNVEAAGAEEALDFLTAGSQATRLRT